MHSNVAIDSTPIDITDYIFLATFWSCFHHYVYYFFLRFAEIKSIFTTIRRCSLEQDFWSFPTTAFLESLGKIQVLIFYRIFFFY